MFSFNPSRRGAVDRIRSIIGDRNQSTALFQDEELRSFLMDSWERDVLGVYYDSTDGSGTTAAMVTIRETASDVEFVLQRTIGAGPAEAEDVARLNGEFATDYLYELVNWATALNVGGVKKGWKVGVNQDGVLTLITSSISPTLLRADYPDLEAMLRRRAVDVALCPQTLCLGVDAQVTLPMYEVNCAAADALDDMRLRKPMAFSDGRTNWTRSSVDDMIKKLRGPSAVGFSTTSW